MLNVIEVKNLSKVYTMEQPFFQQIVSPFASKQRIWALNGVSFDVKAGEVLGVVGPNGAGKTTLLRIQADLLKPDTGLIKILGKSLNNGDRKLRRNIGYASSDERSFFWRLTGRENLMFFGRLYGLSRKQVKERISDLLAQFNFEKKADQLFRDYSAGMRKKVSVIRALLHRPSVLLLDEVTNSLDPESAEMVKILVRKYITKNNCFAAVWSTHRLEEVSQICDRVLMIESGIIHRECPVKDIQINQGNNNDNNYLLRTKSLNSCFEDFCKKFGCKASVNAFTKGNINEFVISGISEEEFGRIVTMAVKDLGAHIIFAGCIKKEKDKNL